MHRKISFEQAAWDQGRARVGGLDEAGRGPLAGPVVAACVVVERSLFLSPPDYFYQIDDSKKLTASRRESLALLLREQEGLEIAIGMADQETIDAINILQATRLAMQRALDKLFAPPDHLLVDGMRLPAISIPQTPIVRGDGLSFAIGAASILAKVFRDDLMDRYDLEYPGYGFAGHKGYNAPVHQEALRTLGPCPAHRRSWAPIRALLEDA